MLAIRKGNSTGTACTPNILPCKIHHNGHVNASQRHWDPRTLDDGTSVAYFRGRKLLGRTVDLPKGYQGVVVQKTDRILPQQTRDTLPASRDEDEDADDNDEESFPEIRVLEQLASFDSFTVWGHESKANDVEDPHIRSIQELMTFSKSMNQFDEGSQQ